MEHVTGSLEPKIWNWIFPVISCCFLFFSNVFVLQLVVHPVLHHHDVLTIPVLFSHIKQFITLVDEESATCPQAPGHFFHCLGMHTYVYIIIYTCILQRLHNFGPLLDNSPLDQRV